MNYIVYSYAHMEINAISTPVTLWYSTTELWFGGGFLVVFLVVFFLLLFLGRGGEGQRGTDTRWHTDKTINRKDYKRLSAFLKASIRVPQLLRRKIREKYTERRDAASKMVSKWSLQDCSCFSLQEAQTRYQKNIWQRCSIWREIHNVWSMVLCFPLKQIPFPDGLWDIKLLLMFAVPAGDCI